MTCLVFRAVLGDLMTRNTFRPPSGIRTYMQQSFVHIIVVKCFTILSVALNDIPYSIRYLELPWHFDEDNLAKIAIKMS
jgi:hypothetical protein